MCAVRTEQPTSGDSFGSLVSPSEVREFAGLPDLGLPEAGPAAAAAGRRLARHPLLTDSLGGGPDGEWVSATQLLLSPLGVHLDLLKLRPGGAVLRCRASSVPGASACDLTKAVLESIPGATGRPGTVVETTCMKRGADACLYMLLWEADGPAGNGNGHGNGNGNGNINGNGNGNGHGPGHDHGPAAPAPASPVGLPVPTVPDETVAAAPKAPAGPTAGTSAAPREEPHPVPVPVAGPNHLVADHLVADHLVADHLVADHLDPDHLDPDHLDPVVAPAPSAGVEPVGFHGASPVAGATTEPVVISLRSTQWTSTIRGAIRSRLGIPGIGVRRRRGTKRASWFRRRAWLLVVAALAGGFGGQWAGNHKGVSYSAQATLVVQSGSGRTGPGSANNADALAVTYSALIPTDATIVDSAARSLGISPSALSHHLSVSVETGTAVMLLKYAAPTGTSAVRGAQTIARAAAGDGPSSAAIPAGSVAVVQLPNTASIAGSLHKAGLPLGIVLGLAVGAILVIAVERADPRVDTADELATVCGCPASVPEGVSAAEIVRAISRVVGPDNPVTVVPMDTVDAGAARSLGHGLAADRAPGEPVFEVGPPFETRADELANGLGPTVLVTGFGVPRRRVQAAVERLRLMGREPLWAALAGSTTGRPELPTHAV